MSKFKRALRWTALLTVLLIVAVVAAAFGLVKLQGTRYGQFAAPTRGRVHFDAYGIPTVEAPDWPTLIETQGYVHASERLWQMDFIRRQAAGRLAEWFGQDAFELDRGRRQEDRQGVALRSVELLPADEREVCEAYARGVNRFIEEHPHGVGIEYVIMRATAERWSCADSVLVSMSMIEELTSVSKVEATRSQWREHLTPEWHRFLYPDEHPWNVPYFGARKAEGVRLPPPEQYLPMESAAGVRQNVLRLEEANPVGSNNWAWRGGSKYFLANDPHLGRSVPQLWYAMRLRVSPGDWVVGASLPGLPGIVLGMNPHLAWAFTNTGEDVDDLLAERLNDDQSQYLDTEADGREVWRPVVRQKFEVKIAGAPSKEGTALFTRRGPLVQRKALGDGYYSHQWLGLNERVLRLPLLKINRARDWDEFNRAFDDLLVPAQHVLFMDRRGNMGYRASGVGVRRRVSGMWLEPAGAGEWAGLRPASERPRMFLPRDANAAEPAFLATANERNWVEEFGGHWGSDDRKDRLRELLASDGNLAREDMEKFQLDTYSRYHRELARWLASHARAGTREQEEMLEAWRDWDGLAESSPAIFSQLDYVEFALRELLLGRVNRHFDGNSEAPMEKYVWDLKRAWVLKLLEAEGNFAAFGLTEEDAANYLIEKLSRDMRDGKLPPYPEKNRWQAQHPFASAVPLLGRLFAVEEYPQAGYNYLVRMETPKYGASVRLVWDLSDPAESTWIFPVGQSGHVGSAHYSDLHELWGRGTVRLKVLDDNFDWGLGDR
nr:hypothetical protein [uncultured bacterium]